MSGNCNITIKNIDIKGFESGILLDAYSTYNNIIGNTVENNVYGVDCWAYADNNSIIGNKITGNSLAGVWIAGSSNDTVTENNIAANSLGINVQSSSNDSIYHNDFVDNPTQTSIYDSPGTWDNGYPSGGNYWSDHTAPDNYRGPSQNQVDSDGICDTAYIIDTSNQDNYPLTKPYGGVHDIGIGKFSATKTVIPQNHSPNNTNITVEAINYGIGTETFTITLYVNTTIINQTQVTLIARDSVTLTFRWNNTGLPKAKYNFTAIASPVLGETETADNTMTLWITITILGDINGDGTVNILDAIRIGNAFLATPGSSNWNPNADLNNDNVVNILDAIILGNNFGRTSA